MGGGGGFDGMRGGGVSSVKVPEIDSDDMKPKSDKTRAASQTFSLLCVSWYLQQIPPVVHEELLTVHFLLWPQQPSEQVQEFGLVPMMTLMVFRLRNFTKLQLKMLLVAHRQCIAMLSHARIVM